MHLDCSIEQYMLVKKQFSCYTIIDERLEE